ncbi:hypothetical protein T484DRAFT_1779813 [Baffinella frigidus]|nr:hypothetical protein T484DRAFT_1779813 [Cryptophyta sp. CCMP2293]
MGTRRLGQRWAGHVFLLLGLVELFLSGAEGQHCGSLGQVNVCREDCGSCGAAPCCTLEWELQGTTPDEFTRLVLELLQNGGSDGLYKLEGHVPNYEDWNVDIADEYPKKIQACRPVALPHLTLPQLHGALRYRGRDE